MIERTYQQARFVIDKIKDGIDVDEITVTREIDAEVRNTISSMNPYDVDLGKQTISWSASDVDPAMRDEFVKLYERQNMNKEFFNINLYSFKEGTGDLLEDDVLYDCWITNIEKTSVNKPFSVEGGALRIKPKS
jgi:hypothetical protein